MAKAPVIDRGLFLVFPAVDRGRPPQRASGSGLGYLAVHFGQCFATGQQVIVDMGVLLGRKPSAEVPAGAKSVKLEDPTRTISRNHAAISFDQDGTLWIEDYGSLNGTYIIQDDVETKVEHKPMQLEAPCTVRIGDQFFQFRKQ